MKKKILLVSGWASDKDVWDEMIEHLPKDLVYERILWTECLGDKHNKLFHVLAQEMEPVAIIGSSLGGLLSLKAVLKYPSKCSELIFVCSTARMVNDEHYVGVDPKIIGAMKFGLKMNRKSVLTGFAQKLFGKDSSPEKIENFLKVTEQFSTQQLIKGLDALLQMDFRHDLRNIKARVLNIHGTKDSIMPIEQSEYMYKHIPESSLEIIENSGHNMLYTHAQDIAERIKGFIKNG
jgi:pimeloyl-ACP methyl ester carboxylesterase